MPFAGLILAACCIAVPVVAAGLVLWSGAKGGKTKEEKSKAKVEAERKRFDLDGQGFQ